MALIAPARAARPMALEHAEPHHRDSTGRRNCPFCPGAEHDTPGELYALREPRSAPNGSRWSLRAVPNKFPAVDADAPAFGSHEVIIECAEHESNPTKLSDDQFAKVFVAYRERMLAHAQDQRLKYTAVFKNVGAEAGASLAHSHSQLLALPEVPDAVAEELRIALEYWNREQRCLMCDVIAEELKHRERLIAETEHFAAFAAYAPRFTYEFWVAPKDHTSQYESTSDAHLAELAILMKRLLKSLDAAVVEPAYNMILHSGPLRSGNLPEFHWHWEVLPRTARVAGFEWGSGAFIVSVPPEQAAKELRIP
jgi:UDPglucose--hexose-1-phosphate uridylyltransferase